MDETTATGTSGWESWLQGIGGNVINAWADANYRQPAELDKLRIQASPYGYEPLGRPMTPAPGAGLGGISPGIMILGGVVLLLLLREKA